MSNLFTRKLSWKVLLPLGLLLFLGGIIGLIGLICFLMGIIDLVRSFRNKDKKITLILFSWLI